MRFGFPDVVVSFTFTFTFTFLTVGATHALTQEPPFLGRMESIPLPARGPAEAPSDWLLAFVDVETTGLLPGYHEMIDIGMILTDVEGQELDRLFLRIQPEHPGRTSPGARAVNGFDAERWRKLGAVAPAEAVERIVSFHRRVAGSKSVLLVAYNSQFDAAFIDHLFRGQGQTWRELYHYFVLDVPSMVWSLGLRQLDGSDLAGALGIEDEPRVAEEHTGITGAELNARIYRALLDRRRGKATSREAVAHDVSPPLSALLAREQAQSLPIPENEAGARHLSARASSLAPESSGEQEPPDEPVPPYVAPPVPEEAAAIEQRTMGMKDAAVLVESFDGLGIGFEGPQGTSTGRNPSDNSLAVGPDHIVQIVNTRLAIFTKKGGKFDTTGQALYGAVPTHTLFHGFGGRCGERNNGDAVVRYDQLADRWLFVMPIFSRGPRRPDQPLPGRSREPARRSVPGQPGQPGSSEPLFVPPPAAEPTPVHTDDAEKAPEPEGVYSMCYAVSTSPDPLGAYYRYEFLRPLFPDYPRPALWPDGYYVPTSTGDDVVEKHACVVDRNRMLRGEPATEQCVILAGVNFLNNADLDGRALPPPGAPNIMLATGGTQLNQVMEDEGIYYWRFHVDWDDPSKTRLDGPVKIEVAPYHYLCDGQLTQCVPQPETDRRLDAQGDKIMARVVYRRIGDRESVVAVHSVNTSTGGGGVRWYELRLDAHRDLMLFQQGTYAPDGSYRWMASPAMDKDGRIGIGYSFGGTLHFAGQRFAARDTGDPPGQLTLRETVLVDGEAAQTETFRWEDYTQTAIDPSDDCTIWYVGDYLRRNENRYSTRIGAFRMGDCESR